MKKTQIVILDFGSQYTQLLARRIRDAKVLSEIIPHDISKNDLQKEFPLLKGIILSGGPSSVYLQDSYKIDTEIFKMGIPVLGICYGMQLISSVFNGEVKMAYSKEFGKSDLIIDEKNSLLFKGFKNNSCVWMSHADYVTKIPTGFKKTAHTDSSIAAISNEADKIYGIQFHAEVTHTTYGSNLISNFIFEICKAKKDWEIDDFISKTIENIKTVVGKEEVILGLSGGVDSSVTAALISKAIGKQLHCIFVDQGLLRKNEAKNVMEKYLKNFDMNIELVDASDKFYSALKGVSDPEQKRKIIGKEFVDVFIDESKKLKNAKWLAQGTIYPDIIESAKSGKTSKVIKSHHNVGGLPKELGLKLLEPIKELFKDEVRNVGRKLGIPEEMISRHPFPGPGLGVRVIGEVTKEKCNILKEVDDIFISELISNDLYNSTSQAFATLLPVKTVGVMGDNRTYEFVTALRCVNTVDFMTATSTHLPWDFLDKVVNRIINEVEGVNRVVYDITSKPPGTIEWE